MTPHISVAQYQRMIEEGILTAEDHVEFLENCVVLKTPRNPAHDGGIQLITETLGDAVPRGWRLRVQLTVVLSDGGPVLDQPSLTSPSTASLAKP